jgi:hypothetical protein
MRRGDLLPGDGSRDAPQKKPAVVIALPSLGVVITEKMPGERRNMPHRSLGCGSSIYIYTHRLADGAFCNF